MCTATWWAGADGYELFFNRDELKTRAPGQDPQLLQENGVRFLAPLDATAGGTWLLVNEFGLTICLINQYPDDPLPPFPDRVSRGRLVTSLADCANADAVSQRLQAGSLSPYEGFLLIALEPGRAARLHRWNTRTLAIEIEQAESQPFSSSRYLETEVLRSRRRRFAELVRLRAGDPTAEDLRAFHEDHAPETGAHSVFMNRDDAETVSLTHVAVNEDAIALEYSPRLPGAFRFDHARRLTLPRIEASATAR